MLYRLFSSFIVNIAVIMIISGMLFALKHQVYNLDKKLQILTAQISEERENIHVLNAEEAYLIAPKRLKTLVENNLHMSVPKREQIISVAELDILLKRCVKDLYFQQVE